MHEHVHEHMCRSAYIGDEHICMLYATSHVQGPFADSAATPCDQYDNLILVVTGSAITSALSTIARWSATRSIFVIWSTRSSAHLNFFLPCLVDARGVLIYYTGEEAVVLEDRKPANCIIKVLAAHISTRCTQSLSPLHILALFPHASLVATHASPLVLLWWCRAFHM